MDSPDKIQWHPGFYGAAELELRASRSGLRFQTELELSKKPLRVDLLIVRVDPGTKIENEVGQIFKGYNIIEYKSPEDSLTIDDFFKTIGYACLYKALGKRLDQYPADEITVSLFRDTYPRELFRALEESGRTIEEAYPGVYYVSGNLLFATQVVVMSRLKGPEHSAFRILSGNAREEDVRSFIKEAQAFTAAGDKNNADAVLQVSISANAALYEDIRRDSVMCNALENLMQDVIEQREREAAERAAKQAAEQAATQATLNSTLNNIRALMGSMKWTAEKAMEALQIPPSEQAIYMRQI